MSVIISYLLYPRYCPDFSLVTVMSLIEKSLDKNDESAGGFL